MLCLYQGIGKDLKQLFIGIEFLLSQLAKVFRTIFPIYNFLSLSILFIFCVCVCNRVCMWVPTVERRMR